MEPQSYVRGKIRGEKTNVSFSGRKKKNSSGHLRKLSTANRS